MDHHAKAKHGFALIVVLSGLAILTSLFAIVSTRSASHLRAAGSNTILSQNMHFNSAALRWVLATPTDSSDRETPMEWSWNGQLVEVQLRDVGGLIDLNTAHPELLELLVAHMNLPPEALETYRNWRRTPYRLLRVIDFLRITGAGPEHRDWLLGVATVHSGRPGVAPEHAPVGVLEVITGQSGSSASNASAIPDHLISPPSGTNFSVWVNKNDGVGAAFLGVVHITDTAPNNRVLWMP